MVKYRLDYVFWGIIACILLGATFLIDWEKNTTIGPSEPFDTNLPLITEISEPIPFYPSDGKE